MFTVWTHIAPVNVLIIILLHNPSSWRQFIFLTNNSITTVSGSPAQFPSFLPMWYLQSKECPCPAVQSLSVCLFWPSCGHRLTVRSLVWWEWGKQRRQSLCCHHTLHCCTVRCCTILATALVLLSIGIGKSYQFHANIAVAALAAIYSTWLHSSIVFPPRRYVQCTALSFVVVEWLLLLWSWQAWAEISYQ